MPCGIAVTITKASVSNEQLAGLVDEATRKRIIVATLADLGLAAAESDIHGRGGELRIYLEPSYRDQIDIRVGRDLAVTIGASSQARSDQLTLALAANFKAVANALFAGQVAATLAEMAGRAPQVQEVEAEEGGATFTARVLTVNL